MNRTIFIKGTVQGVGFRPFVYRLAKQLGVKGEVKNTGTGVKIKAGASSEILDNFITNIRKKSPPSSCITEIKVKKNGVNNYKSFNIVKSSGQAGSGLNIPPDIALCSKCREDIKSPGNIRFEYPFTTCLNCGPRFTMVDKLPYDRKNTRMEDFKMCDRCKEEYSNVDNRRYHAQPVSCPECGPEYKYIKKGDCTPGRKGDCTPGPVKKAAYDLKKSAVIGLKGWGGFHIVGNALNTGVIEKIRELKKRKHKPLAVMARDIDRAKILCKVDKNTATALKSFRRPILLLPKTKINNNIVKLIAPNNPAIGVMLPYSAVHFLLFKYSNLKVLIFTSLNEPSLPTVKNSSRAVQVFSDLPVLDHNLEIYNRCDDSVLKSTTGGEIVLRRSRGHVPRGIEVPFKGRILASGAYRNVNVCFTKGKKAYPSQYIGTVNNDVSQKIYKKTISKLDDIWNYNYKYLACDLHPGYGTSKVFKELSSGKNLPLYKVQHHHAHLVSCAGENKLEPGGYFIGAALDGAGYGSDKKIWGGEFMSFSYTGFTRWGWFKRVPLPGGDIAAREPWRMAISYLKKAGLDWRKLDHLKSMKDGKAVSRLIDSNINCPLTSSAGRLFDAVSSIIGLIDYNTYPARGPIALENAVEEKYLNEKYDFGIIEHKDKFIIDTLDLINGVFKDTLAGLPAGRIGARFHSTVACMVVEGLRYLSERQGVYRACLSGGVFCNYYLDGLVQKKAKDFGLKIYTHSRVSPNDNGISLGQSIVAGMIDSKGEYT